jgi:hypothetical protein
MLSMALQASPDLIRSERTGELRFGIAAPDPNALAASAPTKE